MKVIRKPEVCQRIGLGQSSLARLVREGKFPKPIALGPRAVGWVEDQVDAWIESRQIAAMPSPNPAAGKSRTTGAAAA